MRKSEYEDIVVNVSHMRLKIVLFVIVLIIAVTAFAIGITQIGHKDPGYYTVEAEPDEEDGFYAREYELTGYFEGSSSEIKEAINTAKVAYTAALKLAYKLLDPAKEYQGYTNLASLNQSLGQDVKVAPELFEVLKDAYAKTLEGEGYSMFAGPLYTHWSSIIVVDEPEEFDLSVNEEERERLEKLARLAAATELGRLVVVSEADHIVRLEIGKEYLDYLRLAEEDQAVVNLASLKDAYILDIVRTKLEEAGIINAYLTSRSGLVVSLGGHRGGEFCLYGLSEPVTRIGTMQITEATAFAGFRNFPLVEKELGYYQISAEGRTYYRSPYINLVSPEFSESIASAYGVSYTGDIVGAAYECVRLMAGSGVAGDGADIFMAATLYKDGRDTVYVSDTADTRLVLYPGITARRLKNGKDF